MTRQEEYELELARRVKVGRNIVLSVLGFFVTMFLILSSAYSVDQGERGVILRNGAIIGTAEPGLGFKLPIFDSIVKISTQTQSRSYADLLTYSRDQQTAAISLSVTYRLPATEVEDIYTNFGGAEEIASRLLDRQVLEELKTVFGKFNAVSAIQERERLGVEVQTAIQQAVVGPIIIDSIQIENIDFSNAYEDSIEQRMMAEVEVQRVQQNAEREKVQAEIAVIQAQAQADSRLAQATAEAEAIRLTGEAEAEAIRARGNALNDNPNLVQLVQAEKWNGVLPTTMIPGSTLPFMNMNTMQTTVPTQ